jgi:hypothetical protein
MTWRECVARDLRVMHSLTRRHPEARRRAADARLKGNNGRFLAADTSSVVRDHPLRVCHFSVAVRRIRQLEAPTAKAWSLRLSDLRDATLERKPYGKADRRVSDPRRDGLRDLGLVLHLVKKPRGWTSMPHLFRVDQARRTRLLPGRRTRSHDLPQRAISDQSAPQGHDLQGLHRSALLLPITGPMAAHSHRGVSGAS